MVLLQNLTSLVVKFAVLGNHGDIIEVFFGSEEDKNLLDPRLDVKIITINSLIVLN